MVAKPHNSKRYCPYRWQRGLPAGILQHCVSSGTVYPEVHNGITLIQGGQLLAGVGVIGGALVAYFRATAKKLIG